VRNKPPAFQFYAKDWRSSPNVQRMTRDQRGLYIDLLALAWDSDEPGTIAMTIPQICRELRVYSATLRRLLAEFPGTWRRVGGKLVQPKLESQWHKYKEISAKRSASAQQMHMQKGGSASASAPAFAKEQVRTSKFETNEEKRLRGNQQAIQEYQRRKKSKKEEQDVASKVSANVLGNFPKTSLG
jgi:hypothetical protein